MDMIKKSGVFLAMLCGFLSAGTLVPAASTEPILVGLDADMSSGSARSGESIRRGVVLAMEEINARGGVLGRPLALVVRDHRGNPARGMDNMDDFAQMKNLVAVVGGLHTPVAMSELKRIHSHKIIYLGPWAAGTPVVKNGYTPNYVFRVSVRDEYAGGFLIGKALELGFKKPALLLEQTPWGRSNERSMSDALSAKGLEPATIQWFHWGARDLRPQIRAAREAGADVIMLVANAPEGVAAARSMAGMPESERLPIISHWGITGGEFFKDAGESLSKIDLLFLQTYSFLRPPFPEKARQLVSACGSRFSDCDSPEAIFAPVGMAHAWDLIHLLALAVDKAGTIDRPKVREALEQLDEYSGLVRRYGPPFTPTRHDALTAEDFRLARYNTQGVIVPAHDHEGPRK